MDILGEILKQVLEGAAQGQQQPPQRAPQPQQRAPQPQQRAPQGEPQWMPSPNDLGEIRDANGTVLHDGDSVVLTKGLTLKGSNDTIKIGTKVNNIRLIAGDHEIDCKINGRGILLKAKFVKKA